jgi:hypothetical protein
MSTDSRSPNPASIKPEDCPEPYWHQTHRYCPACSWMEPPCGAVAVYRRDALINESVRPPYLGDWSEKKLTCTLPPGHDGPHKAEVNW